MPTLRMLAVTTHGRYLVEPSRAESAPLLIGFHGYAETAEAQLERLRGIPGSDGWICVSVQGLHRFYRGRGRDREVVASWMTRQDRELLIQDNLAYVDAVVKQVAAEYRAEDAAVFAGFSQGAAMAFRAACASPGRVLGVLAVGGDVPPDIESRALARVPVSLMGRGASDDRYAASQWAADQDRLRSAGVDVLGTTYDGGHDWTAGFSDSVAAWLSRVRPGPTAAH